MNSSFSTTTIVLVLSIITTLAAVVLLYLFILPQKKRDSLPRIGKFAADFFTFKDLYLEKVLRFFYILSTVFCIVTGVLMLFGFEVRSYNYYGYSDTDVTWYGFRGLALAIGGTIFLRLFFEFMMMFILMVKNVLDINKKLKADPEAKVEAPKEAEEPTVQ